MSLLSSIPRQPFSPGCGIWMHRSMCVYLRRNPLPHPPSARSCLPSPLRWYQMPPLILNRRMVLVKAHVFIHYARLPVLISSGVYARMIDVIRNVASSPTLTVLGSTRPVTPIGIVHAPMRRWSSAVFVVVAGIPIGSVRSVGPVFGHLFMQGRWSSITCCMDLSRLLSRRRRCLACALVHRLARTLRRLERLVLTTRP